MTTPLSVSELNNQINSLLETTFSSVYVEGEISNLTYHNSGHIYFSIKDSKSTISCVMFRGNAKYLKFRLEVGAKIIISGSITVYSPRGTYQLLCSKIEPSGIGALAVAYEQLKAKLQIKGYFDKSIKKILPQYPETIYVATSNTGAAIEDMKKILNMRYPLANMVIVPTLVQGNDAKYSIVEAIKTVDAIASADKKAILIVGRGGGSIEDLWSFNEEIVADAIFKATIPIISAVGHESDFVISDFVADVRASTPSNAIEIATPNINDLKIMCDSLVDQFNTIFQNIIAQKNIEIENLGKLFYQHSLEHKFTFIQENINILKNNFNQYYQNIISQKQTLLDNYKNNFYINNPDDKISYGTVQTTLNGKIIDIDDKNIDDIVILETSKYQFQAQIIDKQKIS